MRLTQANALLQPRGRRPPVHRRIAVLGAETPVFIAEWVCGSVHSCRTEHLAGEFMNSRTPDAAADGTNERLTIGRAVGVGECAESDDVEVHRAVATDSAEGARFSGGREGPSVFRLRDHPDAKGRTRGVRELQPRVFE